jgi:hypothetical protein
MRDTKRQCVRFVRFVGALRIALLVHLVVGACESRGYLVILSLEIHARKRDWDSQAKSCWREKSYIQPIARLRMNRIEYM